MPRSRGSGNIRSAYEWSSCSVTVPSLFQSVRWSDDLVDRKAVTHGDADERRGQSLLEGCVAIVLVPTRHDRAEGRKLDGLSSSEAGEHARHPRPAVSFSGPLPDVVDGRTERHCADRLPRFEGRSGLEAIAVEDVERAADDLDETVVVEPAVDELAHQLGALRHHRSRVAR